VVLERTELDAGSKKLLELILKRREIPEKVRL